MRGPNRETTKTDVLFSGVYSAYPSPTVGEARNVQPISRTNGRPEAERNPRASTRGSISRMQTCSQKIANGAFSE